MTTRIRARGGRALRRAGVVAGVGVLAAASLGAPAARAQTGSAGSLDSPQHSDFYTPPADFEQQAPNNGDVIRSEPMPLALSVAGLPGPLPATGERILYRSTGAAGGPVAVSGTVMHSTRPWAGTGPRPLASLAVGTQGQGDQCAPSKSFQNTVTLQTSPFSIGLGYELISAWALLDSGFDVAVTDYEGLGTPGLHPYVDRKSMGHAVLDAARAAQRLPGSTLGADTPVVYTGYSEGGGGAAAAAELAAPYAPELHSVGAAAGAVPADLSKVLDHIDGTLGTGVIGYAINGFVQTHPELRSVLEAKLNPAGHAWLDGVSTQCLADTAVQYGLHRTNEYTTDGRSAAEVISSLPEVLAVIDEQKDGRVKPAFPVRLQGNQNDDAILYSQVEQLGKDWCRLGTPVEYHNDQLFPILPGSIVNHGIPLLTGQLDVVRFLRDRVNGVPVANSCGSDPQVS